MLEGTTATNGGGPNHLEREWTDAAGSRRVSATLLRIEGETLWLRRADGRTAKTSVAQLSDGDRVYLASLSEAKPQLPAVEIEEVAVEALPDAPEKADNKPGFVSTAIAGLSELVQSAPEIPHWLGTGDGKPQAVPAAIVYVRVSRDFLEHYFERSVDQREPVRDLVLGTRIVGTSETKGDTKLTLLPSTGKLTARIDFTGTVHATSRGYNGPVVMRNVSDSTFTAHKVVEFDESGLRVSPASVDAPTKLDIQSVSSSLPGLRGRIASRIGQRRVRSSHREAEAITSEHTADDIRRDFDARIDRSIDKLQAVLQAKIPDLQALDPNGQRKVRFRSTPECLEMVVVRQDASPHEWQLRPPLNNEDKDLTVRVHRTLFLSAIEDPKLIEDMAPLFAKLLEARSQKRKDNSVDTNGGGAALANSLVADAQWAIDREWLSLDYADAGR